MSDHAEDLTRMIQTARDGDDGAKHQLYERLYDEFRQIARGVYGVGRPGDTLQPTVLASEMFIDFERRFPPPPKDMPESRRTFYRSVALAMRTIVRDHARAREAEKRGGGQRPLVLEESLIARRDLASIDGADLLALDEALESLERYNQRWAEVVMHRFYAGRSIADTASMMERAESSVSRDWALAKAWLKRRLESSEADDPG